MLDELDRDHEASEQAEMSASRREIQLQETVKAEEIDEEKWTKLKGRSIVSACRFIQGDVNIMENVLSWNGFIVDYTMPKCIVDKNRMRHWLLSKVNGHHNLEIKAF